MKAYEFDAACLMLVRPAGRQAQIARLHLVAGDRLEEVAANQRVTKQAVHDAAERIRLALDKARRVQRLIQRNESSVNPALLRLRNESSVNPALLQFKIGSYVLRRPAAGSASLDALWATLSEGLSDQQAADRYGITYQAIKGVRYRIAQKYRAALEAAKILNAGDLEELHFR